MEGFGLAILVAILVCCHFYTSWRDNRLWNGGVCQKTGALWEFTGGISVLGYFCYRGGEYKGRQQFIWLSEMRYQPYKFGVGPGTNC